MNAMQYILPLLLSGLTGWLVIRVSTWLLFRPLKPFSVAGFTIQGAIPASQQLMAQQIGRLAGKEFFSMEALQQKVADPENFSKLKTEIETHIDSFLRERLKETFPMLSMLIGDKTISQLKTAFLTELETLFPVLMKSYASNLAKEIDIEKIVTEKIAHFSVSRAEELVHQSARKQLRKLHLLGLVIGLATGLIHILINTQLFH